MQIVGSRGAIRLLTCVKRDRRRLRCGVLACCRFRGNEDKIVTMEPGSGYGEREVQLRVQDRGGEGGDRAGRFGRSCLPRPRVSSGLSSGVWLVDGEDEERKVAVVLGDLQQHADCPYVFWHHWTFLTVT